MYRKAGRQAGRQAARQADRQAGRQACRQVGKYYLEVTTTVIESRGDDRTFHVHQYSVDTEHIII